MRLSEDHAIHEAPLVPSNGTLYQNDKIVKSDLEQSRGLQARHGSVKDREGCAVIALTEVGSESTRDRRTITYITRFMQKRHSTATSSYKASVWGKAHGGVGASLPDLQNTFSRLARWRQQGCSLYAYDACDVPTLASGATGFLLFQTPVIDPPARCSNLGRGPGGWTS